MYCTVQSFTVLYCTVGRMGLFAIGLRFEFTQNTLLSDWLIDWVYDWVIDWLIDWVYDWLSDWVVEWLIYQVYDWVYDWACNWMYICMIESTELVTWGAFGKQWCTRRMCGHDVCTVLDYTCCYYIQFRADQTQWLLLVCSTAQQGWSGLRDWTRATAELHHLLLLFWVRLSSLYDH